MNSEFFGIKWNRVRNLGGCVREESFDVVVIDLYSFRV